MFLIISCVTAWAADLKKGYAAYNSGDYVTALSEWKPLAEQGNAEAQYNLGVMYDNGFGVIEDDREAVKWFRLSAEKGHADAQHNVGVMYDDGQGVIEDDKEAVKWFRLAAEQGDAESQHNLGFMYANGEGVIEDDREAVKWYRLSAEQGHARAQNSLGVMYGNGEGVIEDNVYAHMWLNLAAADGNEDARTNKDILVKWMTPQDISKAQDLARECVNKNYKDCQLYEEIYEIDHYELAAAELHKCICGV